MMKPDARIKEILTLVQEAHEEIPVDPLGQAAELIVETIRNGRHVWIAGNGGSSATAVHLASDLVNKCVGMADLKMRVTCLSANSCLLTALANDHGWDGVYSAQLAQCAVPGDLFLVISVLGGSRHSLDIRQSLNLARGLQTARDCACRTIGIIGASGGSFAPYCDLLVPTRHSEAFVVEPLQSLFSHILVELVVDRLRGRLSPMAEATVGSQNVSVLTVS